MSNVFCFYFDGAIVQAVKTSISGGTVTINDAHTFPYDELDIYLAGCKEKTFIVCCNTLQFQQDILHLPPAASKHYDKLVRTALRKNHPELTSFTTFHGNVGQTAIDSKVYNKVAAFSYFDEPLSDFISAFNRHGKVISHIYAAPYTIFRLFTSSCPNETAQARMFIASLPGEKLLLVEENNALEYVRKVPSPGVELHPEDTHNINMTLDYCFQTLRVRPMEAVMLKNAYGATSDRPSQISVPLRLEASPALAQIPEHLLSDYLAPISASLHSTVSPSTADILPADYATFVRNKKVLTTASAIMAVFALLLAGYALMQLMIISDLKRDISLLRSSLSRSGEDLTAYRRLDDEVKAFSKPLGILNKQRNSLHPAAALAALALPSSKEYVVTGVSIHDGGEFLAVQVDGSIDSTGFSNIQTTFESVVGQLGRISGYSVMSSTLDIKQKTFRIQARYGGGTQKGREN